MQYLSSHDCAAYKSASQQIRVLSESWVEHSVYCPACGNPLASTENNRKACDFLCKACPEEFELKSKGGKIGGKVVDGAYETLMARVQENNNPNLYLLHYNRADYRIENFLVVPHRFFTPSIIEKRKPLASTARRAGWVGCNIVVGGIPTAGKIYYIRNTTIVAKEKVMQAWNNTLFLEGVLSSESRGWLLDTMACIDRIGEGEFTLKDIYQFESQLSKKYPANRHIKDKLRQQLQLLRDKGYLEFVGRGSYRLTPHSV